MSFDLKLFEFISEQDKLERVMVLKGLIEMR